MASCSDSLRTERHHDHEYIRQSVALFFALPFVPLDDLQSVFKDVMKEIHENVHGLAAYKTYVRGRSRRGRRRAVPPRYPSASWNVHESALYDEARKNNVVEGWNVRFQKILGVHHASVWKFLERVQNDQKTNETLISQLQGGHSKIKHPVPKKYTSNQERIRLWCRTANNIRVTMMFLNTFEVFRTV